LSSRRLATVVLSSVLPVCAWGFQLPFGNAGTDTPIDAGYTDVVTYPMDTNGCPPDMRWIPPATVHLGSEAPGNAFLARNGAHVAVMHGYCIDTHETTVRSFVRTSGVVNIDAGAYCVGPDTYPIRCIDFDTASAFCRARGKRLPTSDEWEYAARGMDGRLHPWGSKSRRALDSAVHLRAVGTDPEDRSVFGVEDMGTNAPEWVDDPAMCATLSNFALVRGLPPGPGGSTILSLRCSPKASSLPGFRCVQ